MQNPVETVSGDEMQLAALLAGAWRGFPDPVLLLDGAGEVCVQNEAAVRLGRLGSVLASVKTRLAEATADNPLRGEVLLTASGGLRSYEYCLARLEGEGPGVRFSLSLRDTTERARERERLRLNEERYRLLAQHATDLISRHSPEGVFLYASPAAERLTGYVAHELIGHSLYEFMHPEDLLALSRHPEGGSGTVGEAQFRSYRFRHKRGHFVWLETTLHAVGTSAAGPEGELVAVSRDISRRKEAEAKIHALNETLEQRVAERTAAAEQRARELKRSNDDLAQFAYVASHDLQEPLRVVASYLQLLERKSGGQLDPDGKRYLERAIRGSRRMHTLIQDLLAYSRVGTQGGAFRSVRVEEPLREALANLQVAVEESGATVEHGPLPEVTADATQLTLLFQNLLGNALKFRGEAPPVVRVEATLRHGEWQFSVRDNGIGIPPEFHERVFRVFQRLHTREEYPGNGIGLSICRRIVERHGGRIWVEAAEKEGTVFHFTLPVAAPPPAPEAGE